ncbi:TraB family protein [Cesiribacter andamanensis AMV16]|uniref:TraB family protein n=1 Tax=Cesiribacter andamanensis AMV16 TaxID=1279009 RepID=M7N736_9BACT|nr:TraB family protein [Cesiribacter andamanensis AMV16]
MSFLRNYSFSSAYFSAHALAACLLVACSLLPASVFAQNQDGQSLLWKITGPNLQQPSYLYGTIHAICAEDMALSASMQQALEQSRQLVLEVNITDPAELLQFQQGMQVPASQPLSSYYSAGEYQHVERFSGIPST